MPEEREWFEDDRPRDLSKYDGMTEAEIDMRIAELEAEARAERDRIDRERALAVVS